MKDKNLLVVYLNFPMDRPARYFHALILKYLVRLGWHVTIVTIEIGKVAKETYEEWSGLQVLKVTVPIGFILRLLLRVSFRRAKDTLTLRLKDAESKEIPTKFSTNFVSRFFSTLINTINIFDPYYYFSRHIIRVLEKLHKERPFSAVTSVFYGPFTSYLVARRFARKTGLPWIAMVKDYWSIPPSYQEFYSIDYNKTPRVIRTLRLMKHTFRKRVEAHVLRHADFILPHCQPIADYLKSVVPMARMRILSNCYDDDDFRESTIPSTTNHNGLFTVTCLGSPDVNNEPFHILFNALRDLCVSHNVTKDGFRVRFVGRAPELMRSFAEAYSCGDIVETTPFVEHSEAMSILKQSTCLLFPNRPVLARRVPEYMAARKPILVFPYYDSGASQEILEKYGAAVIARNSQEIAATLIEWYQAFKAGRNLTGPVQEEWVQSFKASKRAIELQDVLEDVLKTDA